MLSSVGRKYEASPTLRGFEDHAPHVCRVTNFPKQVMIRMEMGNNGKRRLAENQLRQWQRDKRCKMKWININEINIIQNENLFFDLDITKHFPFTV